MIKNISYNVRPDKHTLAQINELAPETGVIVYDNVILSGKNTEYYTYMPHVILPVSAIGEVGGVLSGEISLQDLGVGNVDSIVLYQLHLNYKGFNLN